MMPRRWALCLATVLAASGAAAAVPAAASTPAPACNPVSTRAHYTGRTPTPEHTLGFRLGAREATASEIVRYVDAVGRASDRVLTGTFAHSVQGRPMRYALVGQPQTLRRLAQVRADAAALRDPATPRSQVDSVLRRMPVILWIAGNVHGNEPSGADAILRVLYQLADRDDCVSKAILNNALVGLIPTQNPDGRQLDRRTNAYAFDMNRDWFARTQPETRGKLDLLWRYPPQLFVDEHEMGGRSYFFPPNSDPIYHETPNRAYDQIAGLYGAANAKAFNSHGWSFQTFEAGYDLFYQGYGDTVPTTEFGAAGMTFEQGGDTPYPAKTLHHYTTAIVSLYTGATHARRILTDWRATWLQAEREGERCALEPNRTVNPGNPVLRPVPAMPVCGYFLRAGAGAQRIVHHLQAAQVEVYRLTSPARVPDFSAYAGGTRPALLPAGTWWVPMAQPQKHWVQAMLNEDTYVPFPYFYDVSAWSNPLLADVAGGWTGQHLDLAVVRAPAVPDRSWKPPSRTPRIGILDQRPEPTYEYQTTGWLRWRLAEDWHLPFTVLTPETVTPATLGRLDVLLVPDVDVDPTRARLGASGRTALRSWVKSGGRYVGWQGGAAVAAATGLSGVQLREPTAVSPGALVAVTTPAGRNYVLWEDYDAQMQAGAGGRVVASFPAVPFASGYIEGKAGLGGSAVEVTEPRGAGSVTVFSVEPNFRGFTDGSARLLLDAIAGTPTGSATSSVSAAVTGGGAQDTRTPAQRAAHENRGRP